MLLHEEIKNILIVILLLIGTDILMDVSFDWDKRNTINNKMCNHTSSLTSSIFILFQYTEILTVNSFWMEEERKREGVG